MRSRSLLLVAGIVLVLSLGVGAALAHHRADHGGGKPSPSPSPAPSPSPTPTTSPSPEPDPTPEPSPSPDPDPQGHSPCSAWGTKTDYYGTTYVAECEAVPAEDRLAVSGVLEPLLIYPHFCFGISVCVPPQVYPRVSGGSIVIEVETASGIRTEVCRSGGIGLVTCAGTIQVEPHQPVRCIATGISESFLVMGGRLKLLCG